MVKPLGSNPGLHLLLKNHKMYPTLSTSSDDYDEVNTELISYMQGCVG